ncbi:MAG: hypothetical protein HYR85_18230 [Planctomycetes bacterium]|nr:hypothetical protein [Planctomycetota bacterium]
MVRHVISASRGIVSIALTFVIPAVLILVSGNTARAAAVLPDDVPGDSPSGAAVTEDAGGAIRADYTVLARNLADPLLTRPDEPAPLKDFSQLLAEAQAMVVAYDEIRAHTADTAISFVAKEASESSSVLVENARERFGRAQQDGLTPILRMALGIVTNSPGLVGAEFANALDLQDKKDDETIATLKAFLRNRAAQLMLPEIAKRCTGPLLDGPSSISVDFDESWAGTNSQDSLKVQNISSRTLHNCTVLVVLQGAAGDVAQDVHFVQEWESGSPRFARYGLGFETRAGRVGRQTVFDVQEIRVSVWADELRQEGLAYRYPGRERDRDIGKQIEGKLDVRLKYVPTPFFGTGRSFDLTLVGVNSIPRHKITLTFHRGRDSASMSWDKDWWRQGEVRRFDTAGKLAWDPERVDIAICFYGDSYTWRRTLEVPHQHP